MVAMGPDIQVHRPELGENFHRSPKLRRSWGCSQSIFRRTIIRRITFAVRDWLTLDADVHNPFLTSPRIKNAPTLDAVLSLDHTNKNTSWPSITAACSIGIDDQSLQTPLNSLQHSLIGAAFRQHTATPTDQATLMRSTNQAKSLRTYEDALNFLHPDAP